MSEEAKGVSKSPEGLEAPKYGQIELDGKSWAFILDERSEGDAKLYVDTNGDGDLTNDPETEWASRKQGEMTMYSGKAKVQLGPDQIGEIGLYRFDPNDPARAALKNTLMFFVDFGSEFQLKLDDKEFSTFVAVPLSEKASLPMDRNGDGRVSRNYETVQLGVPFNFTGKTYVLDAVDGKLALKQSDTELPMLSMPPDLRIGKKALEFTATTMDGKELSFPKDYKGKIVMLDFWATWCGPCIAEIPNMKTAYEAHHENGFEILGVSFDQANMEENVKTFLGDRELTWPQIYEGKFWETSLGKMHDVSGIPFVLLVDGDSGEILGTSRELRGEGLSDFIAEQLGKKKGSN
jgi:thiol-disulfide isomerase/thioredoxin